MKRLCDFQQLNRILLFSALDARAFSYLFSRYVKNRQGR